MNQTDKKVSGLQLAVLHMLLARLNTCRTVCPGIGGDIDASNIRWLIEHKEWDGGTVAQAVKTLVSLATGLNKVGTGLPILFQDAVDAVNMVNALPAMHEALEEAKKLIPIARVYFPKSIKVSGKFQLENTCACIGKALDLAKL